MSFIIKLFEILRISCIALGFFLAYQTQSTSNALFWLTCLMVIPISGFTALESLLFGRLAAEAKQRVALSDYQVQSAFNNLATALAACLVLLFHFNLQAQATIIISCLLFFTLSSLKHAAEYFIDNKGLIHLQRFLLTTMILGFSIPLLLPIFKGTLSHCS